MRAVTTGKEIRSFKDLHVWQEAVVLVKDTYSLCAALPKEELYGLSSQMKRAAVSIPSNIAEGHAKNHRAEYRQSVYVALGSLAELDTQLSLAKELRFVNSPDVVSMVARMDRIRAMLLTLGKRLA